MMKLIVTTDKNGLLGVYKDFTNPYGLVNRYFKETTRNKKVVLSKQAFNLAGDLSHCDVYIYEKSEATTNYPTIHSVEELTQLAKDTDFYLAGDDQLLNDFLQHVGQLIFIELETEYKRGIPFPSWDESLYHSNRYAHFKAVENEPFDTSVYYYEKRVL